ncbi:MAG: ATP-dependent Clp protease adapter ClpS [Opitutaceae bacterium]|nr:ATP-dependent Clp protease adapter ClpS [Opitutaceae bacterium]
MSAPATKTKPVAKKRKKAAPQTEQPWLVVVVNDPVNLMSYVVLVFKRVLGFSEAKARKHMLEVHKKGRSVVWTGERERAEAYAHTLQTWQLSAQIERADGS